MISENLAVKTRESINVKLPSSARSIRRARTGAYCVFTHFIPRRETETEVVSRFCRETQEKVTVARGRGSRKAVPCKNSAPDRRGVVC